MARRGVSEVYGRKPHIIVQHQCCLFYISSGVRIEVQRMRRMRSRSLDNDGNILMQTTPSLCCDMCALHSSSHTEGRYLVLMQVQACSLQAYYLLLECRQQGISFLSEASRQVIIQVPLGKVGAILFLELVWESALKAGGVGSGDEGSERSVKAG